MSHENRARPGALVVLSFAVAAVFAVARADERANAAPVEAEASSRIIGVTKESTGAVTVTLTPKRHAEGRLLVELAVDTHTVNDLDRYELKEIVSLQLDGKSVAPESAPALRGHHTRGVLVFPLETLPPSISIVIRGLDEPPLRVLSWP